MAVLRNKKGFTRKRDWVQQKNMHIVFMPPQMKPLHIIRKNAFIRMIETNHHTIAIIIDTKHISIQRSVRITDKSCHAVTVI